MKRVYSTTSLEANQESERIELLPYMPVYDSWDSLKLMTSEKLIICLLLQNKSMPFNDLTNKILIFLQILQLQLNPTITDLPVT